MFNPLTDQPTFEFVTLAPAQTDINFDCMLFAANDLVVTRDGVLCTRAAAPGGPLQYLISTTYGVEGGYIRFGEEAVGGEKVLLMRAVPRVRDTNLPEGGPLGIATLNEQMTKQVAMIQDIGQTADDLVTRSIRVPFGETVDELPAAADRISKVLVTDAAGAIALTDIDTFEGPQGPAVDQATLYDLLAAILISGVNLAVVEDPILKTITLDVSSVAAYGTENMQDDLNSLLVFSGGILTKSYNDVLNKYTISHDGLALQEVIQDTMALSMAGTASPLSMVYDDGVASLVVVLDQTAIKQLDELIVPLCDTAVAPTLGVKFSMRLPRDWTVSAVRMSAATGQSSGSLLQADILQNGASIFSTKPTLDNGEKTSLTATTPNVLSTTALLDDAELTFSITQVGDGTARGLNLTLYFTRT